jgi:hypothetical protein
MKPTTWRDEVALHLSTDQWIEALQEPSILLPVKIKG